jgi:hypothetical protein
MSITMDGVRIERMNVGKVEAPFENGFIFRDGSNKMMKSALVHFNAEDQKNMDR